jgi:hypothetical protein
VGYPHFTYERIIGKKSSIGVSAAYRVNKQFPYKYEILPYYRFYFGKRQLQEYLSQQMEFSIVKNGRTQKHTLTNLMRNKLL